ncbi:MAG: WGR domain-containing protein [Acetobacteraceae bacterium]|nr:WGR domain-containing protein [Acetobacteraceae bacterium]MBV8588776.1 WGR domain-containing protein [Acetobacteraceae bacterium]
MFGQWALVREWGRVGLSGTMRTSSFDREQQARTEEPRSIRRRIWHGDNQYQ